MPILGGGIPVVEEPGQSPDDLADGRTLAFRALDGSYPLPNTGNEFVFRPDCEGLDLPPVEVTTRRIPGMDGEQLRRIRTGMREVFLAIYLAHNSSHLGYLDRRDVLAGLFEYAGVDYAGQGGTFDLVANSARGERWLRCVYSDGMTGIKRPIEGRNWALLGITALCPQPFWRGEDWSTPTIRVPAAVSFFGAFPTQISSSQALGVDIPVTVKGDVAPWATIDLVGPASSVTIEAPGIALSIPDGLSGGETAKIVTNPLGRDARFGGVRDWTRLAPSRTFRQLSPGVNPVSITMAGATSASSARVSGPSLYRRPW